MEPSFPPTEEPSGPPRRARFLVGAAVIAATLVGLVVWAMARPGAASFYVTPTELSAGSVAPDRGEQRLNGTVVAGSIERDGLRTSFVVTDTTTEIAVTTDSPMPDAFRDGSEVVAIGRFDGDTFGASAVLAKCPSKFKAKA